MASRGCKDEEVRRMPPHEEGEGLAGWRCLFRLSTATGTTMVCLDDPTHHHVNDGGG